MLRVLLLATESQKDSLFRNRVNNN